MAVGGFKESYDGGVGARMAYSLLTAAITFTSFVHGVVGSVGAAACKGSTLDGTLVNFIGDFIGVF